MNLGKPREIPSQQLKQISKACRQSNDETVRLLENANFDFEFGKISTPVILFAIELITQAKFAENGQKCYRLDELAKHYPSVPRDYFKTVLLNMLDDEEFEGEIQLSKSQMVYRVPTDGFSAQRILLFSESFYTYLTQEDEEISRTTY